MSLLVCIVGSSGLFIGYFLALLGIINIIISYACKWSLQGHFGDNFVFPTKLWCCGKTPKNFCAKLSLFLTIRILQLYKNQITTFNFLLTKVKLIILFSPKSMNMKCNYHDKSKWVASLTSFFVVSRLWFIVLTVNSVNVCNILEERAVCLLFSL